MDDYLTSFSVGPYPKVVGEDNNAPSFPCAAASSQPPQPPHIHVRFSHQIVDGWIDEIRALNSKYLTFLIDDIDAEEYEIESRTLCLSNDLLAEKSGEDCRVFIFSGALCHWPIDAGTALEISDEVVEKARRLRCDLQVDIRSVE